MNLNVHKKQRFFYCPLCRGTLENRLIDKKCRLRCADCGSIIYENQAVGVAAIIFDQDSRILLGKRSRGQYRGLWCIPCGYLEYDEDVYEAVRRELKEETNFDIEVQGVYTVKSNNHDPNNRSVGIWFLARIVGGKMKPGDDLCEVGFFSFNDIPPLAFPTDDLVIKELQQAYIGKILSKYDR